jgi:hypothetical protein
MSVTGGVTQLDELHLTTDLADSYIASAVTWNGKQAALVSGTNIKTINGASVLGSGDLVVSGSSSLAIGTTPITSGTIGRVLFEGTGNVLQQSTNLFWDITNNRLGIGTATPANPLDVNGTARVSGELTVNTVNIGLGAGAQPQNCRVGQSALAANTTGNFNVALGSGALNLNSSGNSNTAIGQNSMQYNTSGSGNVALGVNALNANLTTNFNTAIGVSALAATTTASNTAVGHSSLRYNVGGTFNVAIGTNAGATFGAGYTNMTTVNNSIFIGLDARAAANAQTNQIVIGTAAIGLGSNTTVLGNSSTAFTSIFGNVGIGTTTNAGFKLDVNGTARVSGNFLGGNGSYYNTASQTIASTSSASHAYFEVSSASGSYGAITFTKAGSLSTMWNVGADNSNNFYIFRHGINREIFKIFESSKNIGIDETAATATFTDVSSAKLFINSTTKGFLPPRMTTTQKNAIATPAVGLVVYDTTLAKLCLYTTTWETITSL